ncbi:MAG: hypothetical protein WB660_21370 [Candidatus Sulfotelmatobacter sp.]
MIFTRHSQPEVAHIPQSLDLSDAVKRSGALFTLLDTVNERSHIQGGDFAQANQIDLGVDSSSRYGHVSQVIAHLLQCQTLGQKVRGTSMTQHVLAISLKLQAEPLL